MGPHGQTFIRDGRVPSPSGNFPNCFPVRKSLYDREQVWGGHMRTYFFADCHRTADGRDKGITFTNVYQHGQLGTPLEFLIASLAIKPVSAAREYVKLYERFIWSDYVLRWVMGANSIINEQPMSVMPIRKVGVPAVEGKEKASVPTTLYGRLLTRVMDLRDDKGQPRLIHSTEPFRGEIVRNEGVTVAGPPIDVYLCMEGIFYGPK